MRRRAKRSGATSFVGLDSFLDIVTNVIGALFFVVIYAALSAFGAAGKITMPMASPAETQRILIECRGNTVFFTDVDSMVARSNQVWAQAARTAPGFNARLARLRAANIRNAFYEYRPEVRTDALSTGIIDTFVPIAGALGETGVQIRESDSVFRKRLAAYDPAKYHVIFLTRTDSFEAFHAARSVVLASGFRVGWEPLDVGDPLRFSSGGRDLAVY
jgi:hypothetical protein